MYFLFSLDIRGMYDVEWQYEPRLYLLLKIYLI